MSETTADPTAIDRCGLGRPHDPHQVDLGHLGTSECAGLTAEQLADHRRRTGSATHASGPGAGRPLVAGRCPACGGMALFLGDGGHVTCSRLSCPNPVAADELLHPPQPLADWERELLDKEEADAARRRVWAAALRYGAHAVRDPGSYAKLCSLAHGIEAGDLTPWADQPEPTATPAVPSCAAPAAAGPHPDTPDRAAGVELDPTAIERRAEAATPGPWRAGTTGPRDGGHWYVADQDGQAVAHIHSDDGRNEDARQPDAEFIAHARADVPVLMAAVRRLNAEGMELADRNSKLRGHLNRVERELAELRAQAPDESPNNAPSPAPAPVGDTGGGTPPRDEGAGGQDPPPGAVPEAPGILGRALLDRDGSLWRHRGDGDGDLWAYPDSAPPVTREEVEYAYGPVREVLLVSPAAGRVLDAARAWRRVDGPLAFADETTAAVAELRAAVDALAGDQPAEPAAVTRAMDTEPDLAEDAEMDGAIAEFAALPDCEHCGGTGKQVPDGWYERRREAERYARRVLTPAVERYLRDAGPARDEFPGLTAAARVAGGHPEPAPEPDPSNGRQMPDQPGPAQAAGSTGDPSSTAAPEPVSPPPDGHTCPCPRGGWHPQCAVHQDRNSDIDKLADMVASSPETWKYITDRYPGLAHQIERVIDPELRDGELAEVERLRTAADRLSVQLAEVSRERGDAQAEADRLRGSAAPVAEELVELRAEVDRLREAIRHRDRAYDEVVIERDRAAEALATARRDAAADALHLALNELIADQGPGRVTDIVARLLAEIRAETRPVPGSPQPADQAPRCPCGCNPNGEPTVHVTLPFPCLCGTEHGTYADAYRAHQGDPVGSSASEGGGDDA